MSSDAKPRQWYHELVWEWGPEEQPDLEQVEFEELSLCTKCPASAGIHIAEKLFIYPLLRLKLEQELAAQRGLDNTF